MTRRSSLALLTLWVAQIAVAEAGSDWPVYGGDAGGQRYSSLAQISRSNVAELEEAWRIRTGDLAVDPPPPAHMAFQATPILVDGLLILPTPLGRVLALDPTTGAERWWFDATVRERRIPEFTSRGVAAWRDSRAADGAACARRIFAATIESRLFALDAATGRRCPGFGRGGEVSLRAGVSDSPEYTISSPPLVAGDLVVVGSAISDNQRVDMPRGVVRAYDARSGELAWSWDPIPRTAADPIAREWRSEQARLPPGWT